MILCHGPLRVARIRFSLALVLEVGFGNLGEFRLALSKPFMPTPTRFCIFSSTRAEGHMGSWIEIMSSVIDMTKCICKR